MYKDKDKRRDKERDRQRRYRASKGVTGVTEPKGVTNEAQTSPMLDAFKDENIRRQEYEDKLDLLKALAMKDTGGKPERTALGNIRVSKPGDDDYVPMCETTRSYIGAVPEVPGLTTLAKPKRGLDIKCFKDLPPDVQRKYARIGSYT